MDCGAEQLTVDGCAVPAPAVGGQTATMVCYDEAADLPATGFLLDTAVVVDIDSTLAAVSEQFIRVFRELAPGWCDAIHHEDVYPGMHWDWPTAMCHNLGVDPSAFWTRLFEPEVVERTRVYAEAAHVLSDLAAAGVRVTYLSHRPAECLDATTRWLRRHKFPFPKGNVFVGGHDKVQFCLTGQEGHRVVLVDDRPDTIEAAKAAGVPVATLLHPWNVQAVFRSDVPCARDWRSLGTIVERLLRGEEVHTCA